MLCFVFSALAVVLDQLFKRWAVLELATGGDISLIPGIIGLTYVENTGAAFGIFSNMRWVLAGIAFICAIILVLILLRYNGGFWSRLGLAAVLGGAVGNLIDRVFRGGIVVDMFEFKFFDFAIFNVADIFLTIGGITFCVFYLIAAAKEAREEKEKASESPPVHKAAVDELPESAQKPRVLPKPAAESAQRTSPHVSAQHRTAPPPVQRHSQNPEPPPFKRHPPVTESAQQPAQKQKPLSATEYEDYLRGLSSSSVLEEFDLDKLMKEYGLNDDKD